MDDRHVEDDHPVRDPPRALFQELEDGLDGWTRLGGERVAVHVHGWSAPGSFGGEEPGRWSWTNGCGRCRDRSARKKLLQAR